MNLQEAGLFKVKNSKSDFTWDWEKIKSTFNLVDTLDIDGKVVENASLAPIDYRYVHNGYAPLSVSSSKII